MEKEKNIRVGIRGAAGLLGSRLATYIARAKDIQLTVGIFRNDPTLQRMIDRYEFGGPLVRNSFPKQMYLDESDKVITEINKNAMGIMTFLSVKELNLKQSCDVIIDVATPSTKHVLQKQYQEFPGPIILQDGAYPKGQLIAPPIIAPPQAGNKFRQGGCFLSGVVPVLALFHDIVKSVRIHLVMQHNGREKDFLITERINTFRIADMYIPRMNNELTQLFPETKISVESVIQIPGMLHYAVCLEIETKGRISISEVLKRFNNIPRIRVLPDSVMSTYDINLARVIDDRIPPILMFSGSVKTTPLKNNNLVHMKLALYYRTLAVLPNIDAIRILGQNMDPIAAMRKTDQDAGF